MSLNLLILRRIFKYVLSDGIMNLIIMFGPPGVGKGTQSELLAKKLGFLHLSTGNALRQEVANQTELGKKVDNILKKGHLVSDEIVTQIVENFILRHQNGKGFILDGFPRTVNQAESLAKFCIKLKDFNLQVINLTADEQELVKRLLKRGKEHRRMDDNEQVIKQRLEVYENETFPVLKYYKRYVKVFDVNGVGEIEEINKNIIRALREN